MNQVQDDEIDLFELFQTLWDGKWKIILITFSFVLSVSFSQDNAKTPGMETADDKDLKVGDVAPSWALMYAPGKFEFLKNWAEVDTAGAKLRKFMSQPDKLSLIHI